MKYIEMPIEVACQEKWKVGREKYGPKFVGEPAEQFADEMIDALNYLDEMERQGYDSHQCKILKMFARSAFQRVREMYESKNSRLEK